MYLAFNSMFILITLEYEKWKEGSGAKIQDRVLLDRNEGNIQELW